MNIVEIWEILLNFYKAKGSKTKDEPQTGGIIWNSQKKNKKKL